MKKVLVFAIVFIFLISFVSAEIKPSQDFQIPAKLTEAEKKDAPRLSDNVIYPNWGVPCMEFTYKVRYYDDKGRAPEYVRINLNGEWHDMQESGGDYKTGMLYTYKLVAESTKPNFYYFEASNGAGKARAGIIDSPDSGPLVLFEKFDSNQIILLDKQGKEAWTYDLGKDMVEGVSISDNGYVAAVTNYCIYLFSADKKEPLWKYCTGDVPEVVLGSFAGIEISDDGNYIAAGLDSLYYFSKDSNQPLWVKPLESGVIGLDISADGSLIAFGTANADDKGDKIFIYDDNGKKISEYRAEHPDYVQTGNFYQPDMTPDGRYIAVSTGCPDRRAYLFSGNGSLVSRSEQLTYDSPVHKSAISDDGSLIAYSLDNMEGKEIVMLFDNKGKKMWGFSSADDSTSRAVSMSNDGNYIAAGTSKGNIYLFSKNSNKPLWKFSDEDAPYVQFGDVKLNSDGSLLAVGGTSKKVYLFNKNSNKPLWLYNAPTWINKIDFNGNYVVAGTGMKEYLGEGVRKEQDFTCTEVIKVPEEKSFGSGPSVSDNQDSDRQCATFDNNKEACLSYSEYCYWMEGKNLCEMKDSNKEIPKSQVQNHVKCGNGICEGSETKENCYEDCCGENCDLNEDAVSADNQKSIEEKEVVSTKNTEEKGFFEKIIDFFKGLFR